MPWCPSCDRYLTPPTVHADGTCPGCGAPVDPGRAGVKAEARPDSPDGDPLPPVPWHLKLLGVAIAVYLGYRGWQGVDWLVHHL